MWQVFPYSSPLPKGQCDSLQIGCYGNIYTCILPIQKWHKGITPYWKCFFVYGKVILCDSIAKWLHDSTPSQRFQLCVVGLNAPERELAHSDAFINGMGLTALLLNSAGFRHFLSISGQFRLWEQDSSQSKTQIKHLSAGNTSKTSRHSSSRGTDYEIRGLDKLVSTEHRWETVQDVCHRGWWEVKSRSRLNGLITPQLWTMLDTAVDTGHAFQLEWQLPPTCGFPTHFLFSQSQ